MSDLQIVIEPLDTLPATEADPEERACLGQLVWRCGHEMLTEGVDGFTEELQTGPRVSGYPLAEWMAWNWWRLTCETRPARVTEDWCFAHDLGTVGGGYVWPNLRVFSDSARTALIAMPTHPRGRSAFRSTGDRIVVLPTARFIEALDRYMEQMQALLRKAGIAGTNLDHIWDDVQQERRNPESALRRALEAQLGHDPGEGPEDELARLLDDAPRMGNEAVLELAAARHFGQAVPNMDELLSLAERQGYSAGNQDRVSPLPARELPAPALVPAWRRGYAAAQVLRRREGWTAAPLSNDRLAQLCAVSPGILERTTGAALAFSLHTRENGQGRIVLRSQWETGRRFELARLLGDWLLSGREDPLQPATASRTYRQKQQRAFAAELLCPLEALEETLAGDYSQEAREDAAQTYRVSEKTVTTLLVNHHRLGRDLLEYEYDEAEE